MRLFEVTDRFVDDLETVIRLQIKGGKAKKASEPMEKEPEPLTYPALSQLLNNMGYGNINHTQFVRIYDENPSLAPLIADYNEEYIILGTDDKTMPQSKVTIPAGPSVDQMASRGAAKHMANIS